MIKRIVKSINVWWKKHIIDECPKELEEYEFSDKNR